MTRDPYAGCCLVTNALFGLSRFTARICRQPGETGRTATHIGSFLNAQWTIEAQPGGRGLRGILKARVLPRFWPERMRELDADGIEWLVLGPDPALTRSELLLFKGALLHTINPRYAFLELPLQALDERRQRRTGKRSYLWRRLGSIIPNNGICSKMTARAYIAAGLWPKERLLDDPDHQYDWMRSTEADPFRGRSWRPVAHSADWFTPPTGKDLSESP